MITLVSLFWALGFCKLRQIDRERERETHRDRQRDREKERERERERERECIMLLKSISFSSSVTHVSLA